MHPPYSKSELTDSELWMLRMVWATRGAMLHTFSFFGLRSPCGIESVTSIGDTPAIVPTISGRAWITGTRQLMLDPDDPWPAGYRLSDTWPRIGN